MEYLPFKIEVLASKDPIVSQVLKTNYYLVYQGDFGKANYSQDEFILDWATFVSPAEHLYGNNRYSLELKLQGFRGVEKIEFVALFDEIADSVDFVNK